MAEKEVTGKEILGGLVGAAAGNVKGTALGGALCVATIPVLGPLALVLPFAGAIGGTVAGAKIGSGGLANAAALFFGISSVDI